MRTITKDVYQFDELSDSAKETAREWYREGGLDYEWWDCSIEDFCNIGDLMGIDMRQRRKSKKDGTRDYAPSVYFSGFYSQGDGASFDAHYQYQKGALKAVKAYAPNDRELHRIASALQSAQKPVFYTGTASVSQSGRYHSLSVSAECDDRYSRTTHRRFEDEVTELLRDFASWIYNALEREYEYLNSDECVDDSIRANEYEFYENGERI